MTQPNPLDVQAFQKILDRYSETNHTFLDDVSNWTFFHNLLAAHRIAAEQAQADTIASAEAREAEKDATIARLREALEQIAGHETEKTREDCRHLAKSALGGGIEDAWRPMDEWDGRDELVFLLVDYENGDHPLEDCKVGFTIGHCAPDSEAGWQFAGWCWSHDHYTEGRGEPMAWMPVPAGMLFRPHHAGRVALGEQP